MVIRAMQVEEKRQQLPTVTRVKSADLSKPARPSEARIRRTEERLKRSPFATDED